MTSFKYSKQSKIESRLSPSCSVTSDAADGRSSDSSLWRTRLKSQARSDVHTGSLQNKALDLDILEPFLKPQLQTRKIYGCFTEICLNPKSNSPAGQNINVTGIRGGSN